ncbi:permease [Paracoccus marinaquae]|uniref:Permease n=1 Tax=Paracoccus marinaquae TaxID=2841926 RepID=A0ABS6AM77_9RHOB|nr:permease [Paracoccus marinaquae]MBU3031286.1 permease [Paracoccus marinaquae]
MNDMEWSGAGDPEGPFAAGARVVADGADRGETSPQGCDPEQAIAVADGLFWSYIRDLEAHQQALAGREGGAVDPTELKNAVQVAKGVREAVHLMMTERNKVDRLRKDIAGGVGGGSLDLDAARDEIGRRLACLRRAAGG